MAIFQVPQFIDEKPKIVGSLTLRQFLYIAGAALISVILFNIFNFFFWMLATVILGAIAISLAFIKVNGQELSGVALAGFYYMWNPRTYTWQRMAKNMDVSDLERIKATRNAMSIQDKIKSMTMRIATGKIFSDLSDKKVGAEKFQTITRITGEKVVARRIDY